MIPGAYIDSTIRIMHLDGHHEVRRVILTPLNYGLIYGNLCELSRELNVNIQLTCRTLYPELYPQQPLLINSHSCIQPPVPVSHKENLAALPIPGYRVNTRFTFYFGASAFA